MTAKKNQVPQPYTQSELDEAAAAENQEMEVSIPVLMAQKQHLSNRVVMLRAENMRLRAELEKSASRQPQDRLVKKKKT